LVGRQEGHPACKNWVVGCWRGCLGWGADLHIAQQMPLPLNISCSSKSRLVLPFLVLPFWYLLTRVVPGKFQKSSKTIVCVFLLTSSVSDLFSVFTVFLCSVNSVYHILLTHSNMLKHVIIIHAWLFVISQWLQFVIRSALVFAGDQMICNSQGC